MTDQPDDQPDDQQHARLPELTAEQESEVRRMLAEARHEEPIPADVAERLDAVLADLGRDEPHVAPVIDLAARRRRRNAAAVLAGAAAVIVAGFAVGQVVDVRGGDDSDAGGANASSDRVASAAASPATGSPSDGLDGTQEVAPGDDAAATLPLRLRSDHLRDDVTSQLRGFSASGDLRSPDASAFSAVGCAAPTPSSKFGLGELFPALFDGRPAVLALRPATGADQQADVLDCDTASQLASTTVPAR